MIITRTYRRKDGLYGLCCFEERVGLVDLQGFLALDIKEGDEVDEEFFAEILLQSDERRAKNSALHILSRRDHSKGELYGKLQKKVSGEAAQAAVNKMEELGLVNDAEYAVRLARDLINRRFFSCSRAKYELIARGIDRDTAESALRELDADEREIMRKYIGRKYAHKLGDEKGVRQAFGALGRLGYSYEDIRAVLGEYIHEE